MVQLLYTHAAYGTVIRQLVHVNTLNIMYTSPHSGTDHVLTLYTLYLHFVRTF